MLLWNLCIRVSMKGDITCSCNAKKELHYLHLTNALEKRKENGVCYALFLLIYDHKIDLLTFSQYQKRPADNIGHYLHDNKRFVLDPVSDQGYNNQAYQFVEEDKDNLVDLWSLVIY